MTEPVSAAFPAGEAFTAMSRKADVSCGFAAVVKKTRAVSVSCGGMNRPEFSGDSVG
ncbi:MAG: hypothetical protein V4550_12145 [Gemmatimonadota bacterium]